jgi:hypothetical protein
MAVPVFPASLPRFGGLKWVEICFFGIHLMLDYRLNPDPFKTYHAWNCTAPRYPY